MDALNWSWIGLVALGAFHGANPAMGWLFAVAIGMQERRRSALWWSLVPLAGGHALAIGAAVVIALLVGAVLPLNVLRWTVGAALLALGVSRLFRHGHPRWVGMQVTRWDLTVWSFLMASAHGAGLMVLPLVLAANPAGGHHHHLASSSAGGTLPALSATLAHSAGYVVVSAVLAWIVFEKVGVGLLRRAWLNLDLVWAAALLLTSIATLMVT
jgi:hypothetical protein